MTPLMAEYMMHSSSHPITAEDSRNQKFRYTGLKNNNKTNKLFLLCLRLNQTKLLLSVIVTKKNSVC